MKFVSIFFLFQNVKKDGHLGNFAGSLQKFYLAKFLQGKAKRFFGRSVQRIHFFQGLDYITFINCSLIWPKITTLFTLVLQIPMLVLSVLVTHTFGLPPAKIDKV